MPVIPPPTENPFPAPHGGGIGERLANGLGYVVGSLLQRLWEPFANLGAAISQRIADVHAQDVATPLEEMNLNEGIIVPGPFRLGPLIAAARTLPAWAQLVAFASIIVGIFRELAQLAAKRLFGEIGYAVNREVPLFRISAEDGRMAERRNKLAMERLRSDLADEGVDPERAEALLEISYRWLSAFQVNELLNREFIDEPTAFQLIKGTGLPDDQVSYMLELRHYLPPVSDLTRFAIRGVFDPNQAPFLNQYPAGDEYYRRAKQLGMDESVAQFFWEAHWKIPEQSVALRMWHRLRNGSPEGVQFTEEDLRSLLNYDDWLLRYQDPMIASSWTAPSAFLIRGMIDTGAITPDRARVMLEWSQLRPDFVDDIINWANIAKHTQNRDLTRADLVADYKDHLVTREQTAADLAQIGYDPGETELILARADWDLAKVHVTRRTATIKANYTRGKIAQAEAIEELVALGKAPDEVSDLIDQWDAARHDAAPVITNERLIALYKDRVITEPQLRERLLAHALSEEEIGWLIDQADAQMATENARKTAAALRAEAALHKHPTKADLAAQLRKGVIDGAAFTSALLGQGYAQADIDRYATQARITAVTPPYKSEAGKLAIATARERFRDGTTNPAGLSGELAAAGVPQNVAQEIVDYETALVTPSARVRPAAPVAPYKTAEGKLRVNTAVEAYRDRTLTANDLRIALEGIGMPPALAQATVANEVAKLTPPSPALGIPPIPDYQTPIGKQKTAAVRTAFHRGLLTAPELHAQLIALQYPEAFAGVIVDYENARVEEPPAA